MATQAPCEPAEVAADAGLRYISDGTPGIRRRKRGSGFSYEQPDGTVITDRRERARIAALVIPPAWTDVWISPDPNGHVLATGRDAKGRKQYLYHPTWRAVRDADKYDKLPAFGRALPEIRTAVGRDLTRRGMPREKVLALVVKLLDETLIRVGNEAYATENESYGLTTLKSDHVELDGSDIVFDFVGKSGLEHERFLHDRQLARIVRQCHELGGQDLFTYRAGGELVDVTSGDVNLYLRELTDAEVTAKDFRTWGGTATAAAALAIGRPPGSDAEAEKQILAAYDVAAEVLGNTRTVCRNCYVHPAVPDAYRSGELHETWRRSRPTATLDRKERTVLKLLER
jgi:DNA topoisomerase-1